MAKQQQFTYQDQGKRAQKERQAKADAEKMFAVFRRSIDSGKTRKEAIADAVASNSSVKALGLMMNMLPKNLNVVNMSATAEVKV